MNETATAIGCERCQPYGRAGYRFDSGRDRATPYGRVVVCECVVPHCRCGALRIEKNVVAPAFDDLPGRASDAVDERDCACWPVRRHVARLNRLMAQADVPDLYRGRLLDAFRTEAPRRGPIQEAEIARGQASTWVEQAIAGTESKGLYLYGVPGDGKTLLASGLLNEYILRAGRPGLFVHLSRGYFQRLRNTFDDDIPGAETTEQAFNRMTRVPLLVLDDLGIERGSAWEVEWLYNLVDERYQKRRPLVVTSNYSLEELRELSRGRITSRLQHMCRILKMPDEDLRTVFDYGS